MLPFIASTQQQQTDPLPKNSLCL